MGRRSTCRWRSISPRKGNNLAGVGIAPDVEVALTDAQSADFYFLSPEEDPQLQKAVEILG